MRMRHVLIGMSFLIVVWVSWQMPVPGMKLTPMQPNPNVPTFAQATAQHKEMALAASYGAVVEDPKLHTLRKAELDAAQQVEAFPCDAKWRGRLADAVIEFWSYNREISDKPPTETRVVDGKTIDARGFLNTDASDAARQAANAGIVNIRAGFVTFGSGEVAPHVKSKFLCETAIR